MRLIIINIYFEHFNLKILISEGNLIPSGSGIASFLECQQTHFGGSLENSRPAQEQKQFIWQVSEPVDGQPIVSRAYSCSSSSQAKLKNHLTQQWSQLIAGPALFCFLVPPSLYLFQGVLGCQPHCQAAR